MDYSKEQIWGGSFVMTLSKWHIRSHNMKQSWYNSFANAFVWCISKIVKYSNMNAIDLMRFFRLIFEHEQSSYQLQWKYIERYEFRGFLNETAVGLPVVVCVLVLGTAFPGLFEVAGVTMAIVWLAGKIQQEYLEEWFILSHYERVNILWPASSVTLVWYTAIKTIFVRK